MDKFFKKPGWQQPGFFFKRALLSIVAAAVMCAMIAHRSDHALSDPDRHFHFELSKITAEKGRPETLPQVEDLGWNRYFPDKEYLFHVFTTALWRIGGERAVEKTPLILGGLIAASIAWILSSLVSFPVAMVSVLFMLFSGAFPYRLTLLRPHSLAILIFIWMLHALITRRRKLAAVCGVLFALAYHAIYIPFALIAAFFVFDGRRSSLKLSPLLAAAGGIVVGTLINPYFPGAFFMGIRHLMIAGGEAATNPNFGTELMPLRADIFLKNYSFEFALFFFFLLNVHRLKANGRIIATGVSFGLFTALSMLSPRAVEYAAPLAVMTLAMILDSIKERKAVWIFSVIALLAGTKGIRMGEWLLAPQEHDLRLVEINEAISKLPVEGNYKIFNCEWDSTPYILHSRPDARFIDILDPSFLETSSPALYQARKSFMDGVAPDAYGIIDVLFGAKYSFCRSATATRLLDSDPHFRRVFPQQETLNHYYVLHESLGHRHPAFFADFETTAPTVLEPKNGAPDLSFLDLGPDRLAKYSRVTYDDLIKIRPIFLDLFKIIKKNRAKNISISEQTIYCAHVRPTKEEMASHKGSTLLAFGGGSNIRAWFNGAPLYSSVEPSPRPRLINGFIKLDRPLVAADELEAIVCSANASEYMGLSLSAWTDEEIEKTCKWKNWQPPKPMRDGRKWKAYGLKPQNCLAPVLN